MLLFMSRYLLNNTNLVSGTHLKWWAPKTPLAKQNNGSYDFVIERKMALPIDSNFFIDILKGSKRWGNKLLLQVGHHYFACNKNMYIKN